MKKSILLLILLSFLCSAVFSGCRLSFEDEDTDSAETNSKPESSLESLSTRKAKVSIIQYMDYTELNECCEGVKSALNQTEIEYNVLVGSSKSPEQDCYEFAQNIEINGGCDLIIAIGTPAAVSAHDSVIVSSNIPVIFCAVADPVGANLIDSVESPNKKCTVVATPFNIKEQLNMINTFQPYITKLGVIYTKDEQNTERQMKILRSETEKLGIYLYEQSVSDPSQLADAAAKMVPEVDAITLLADNMISANSWEILNQAIIGSKPVYAATLTSVKEGCLAGYCYDFKEIGKKAGETAISVLRGQSAAEMPIDIIKTGSLYVNSDMLKQLEMTVPENYSSAQLVKTSYQ